MKLKLLTLVNGDEYCNVELSHAPYGVFPGELDPMMKLSLGNKDVYINSQMIVSFELDHQLKEVK